MLLIFLRGPGALVRYIEIELHWVRMTSENLRSFWPLLFVKVVLCFNHHLFRSSEVTMIFGHVGHPAKKSGENFPRLQVAVGPEAMGQKKHSDSWTRVPILLSNMTYTCAYNYTYIENSWWRTSSVDINVLTLKSLAFSVFSEKSMWKIPELTTNSSPHGWSWFYHHASTRSNWSFTILWINYYSSPMIHKRNPMFENS